MMFNELLDKLYSLDKEKDDILNIINNKNKPWHLDLDNTYFTSIPKDIFNIIYRMFPGQWHFNKFYNYYPDASCLNCGINGKFRAITIRPYSFANIICYNCSLSYIMDFTNYKNDETPYYAYPLYISKIINDDGVIIDKNCVYSLAIPHPNNYYFVYIHEPDCYNVALILEDGRKLYLVDTFAGDVSDSDYDGYSTDSDDIGW